MNTRITVVVDNIGQDDMLGEWGLSILVEHNGKKILVDTGASELFADNLKKLGCNIEDIDYAILSHAHYDHSNGMARFFADNKKAKFFIRDGAGENCYFKKFIFKKYIGIPRNILCDYPDRIEFAKGDYELCEGAYLIPHKTEGLDKIGKREMMYQKHGRSYRPDDFCHEQSLVLDTDKGLVIINSCSHGGAANIIKEVTDTFPNKKVYGLIGGLHLFNKSTEDIQLVSKQIKDTGIKYVCTGHCTKGRAYSIMREDLGDMLEQLHVGLVRVF